MPAKKSKDKHKSGIEHLRKTKCHVPEERYLAISFLYQMEKVDLPLHPPFS